MIVPTSERTKICNHTADTTSDLHYAYELIIYVYVRLVRKCQLWIFLVENWH